MSKENNATGDANKTFTPPDNSGTPSDIYRVAVRIPPFWPDDPALWFAQVESNFTLSRITEDETKFLYVTSQLDNIYASEVKDIIINPPNKGKFETLKTELIKRLSASREKQMKQLLMHEELGDRRPSQFLRHLQHLAGPGYPDEFLKTTWTSRLPVNLQTVIASQPNTSLTDLADLADKVHELVPATPQVASVNPSGTITLQSLMNEVSRLSRQVEALSTGSGRSRSTTRGNNRDRSRPRSQSNYRKFPICFYHHKYGDKARRCQKPCDYGQGNHKGSR